MGFASILSACRVNYSENVEELLKQRVIDHLLPTNTVLILEHVHLN